MASPQPNREQAPKVYLRNEVYSPAAPETVYARPYKKTPVSYEPGETIIYTRQPASITPQSLHPSRGPPVEQPFDVDDSTLRSGAFSEASNGSKISKSSQRPHHRYHHHHHHNHPRQKVEDPDGYWQVPHTNNQDRSEHSTMSGPYKTPGGRQLSKTPKKHTAGVQVVGIDQVIGGDDRGGTFDDVTQELEEYMRSSQYLPTEDSEMTVS